MLVEIVTAALFAARGGSRHTADVLAFDVRLMTFVVYAAFVWVMVVITFIDIDHMLILDKVTIPSIVVFYAASLLYRRWWEGLIGIAVGYGVPWLIGEIYIRIRKREGMGLGDAKLLALVGALLGWKGVLVSLFGGSVLGTIIHVVLLARAKKDVMQSELPFGPYLAAGAVFYLFAEPFIELYFRLV